MGVCEKPDDIVAKRKKGRSRKPRSRTEEEKLIIVVFVSEYVGHLLAK
jgi:hypothetical protein